MPADRRAKRAAVLESLNAKPVPQSSSPRSSPKGSKGRQAELLKVFRQFDLDDSGEIESSELLELGKARRKLGQKTSVWNEEKNARCLRNMDVSGDGLVDEKEFASYFDSRLPSDPEEFGTIIEQFMDVARSCRAKKLAKRKTSPRSSNNPSGAAYDSVLNSLNYDEPEPAPKVELDPAEVKHRQAQLRKVYREFDLDGGGDVGDDELLLLGQTRRKLGQKQGEWTKAMNDNLMTKIGTDRNGSLPENNFVRYFNGSLAPERAEFDKTIVQFMDCAKACRKTKIAKRETEKKDAQKKKEDDRKIAKREAEKKEAQKKKEDDQKQKDASEKAKRQAQAENERKLEAEKRQKAAAAADEAKKSKADQEHRQNALRKVYREFDLDGGGDVGDDELLLLGQTRRKLGQKQGEWTKAMNDNLMTKIGTDRNGSLPENNFVRYFNGSLAPERAEFDKTIVQFMDCAKACRKTKIAKRETEKAAPPPKQERNLGTPSLMVKPSKACENTLNGHSDYVISVAFSHESNTLVSCSHDHDVRIWNASTGRCIQTLKGHTGSVYCCDISKDGKIVASGSHDRMLCLWDVEAGRPYHHLFGHSEPVKACRFSPTGELLVSASYDGTLKLWNTVLGDNICTMNGHTSMLRCCDFSSDGTMVASGGDDHTMRVWEVPSGRAVRRMSDHTRSVMGCAFSPDGRLLASASQDNTVRMYQLGSWQCLQVFEGHSSHVFSCTFSPDSFHIATSGDDLAIRLWEVATGKCVAKLEGHGKAVYSSSFSSARRQLATASHDQTIRLWNLEVAEHERTAFAPSQTTAAKPTRVDIADSDAKWRAREESAKQKAAMQSESSQTSAAAADDDAKWQAREERAKQKAAMQSEPSPTKSAAGDDEAKMRAREERAKLRAKLKEEPSPKGTVDDDAKWQAREERLRLRASPPAAKSVSNRPSETTRPKTAGALSKGTSGSQRQAALRGVFRKFDLDRGGFVEARELFALGKARRTSGQKKGEWTEEKNQRLIRKMDTNGDGQISESEFTEYFSEALPSDPLEFDAIINQFLRVAKMVSPSDADDDLLARWG